MVRSSYCASGLCSSSPTNPPSSAPIYQSRSRRTCSSSHSRISSSIFPSSGLPPRNALGVGASQPREPAPPHPPASPSRRSRGVASHLTFGTRRLGASSRNVLRSERGVASQTRGRSACPEPLSRRRSRFKRRWKSSKPRGRSSFLSWWAVIPSGTNKKENWSRTLE